MQDLEISFTSSEITMSCFLCWVSNDFTFYYENNPSLTSFVYNLFLSETNLPSNFLSLSQYS